MKKFLLTPLLTLFTCVMVWADPVNVGTWTELVANTSTSDAEITLTADITMQAGTHNLNGAHISCGDYQIKVTATGEYTIRNADITFGSGTTGYMYIYKNKATENVAINLENASITSANTSKGAIYFRTFTCTLNVDNNSTISSTANSGVQASAALTINNNGIISGITGVSAGTAEITNSGSITGTTGAGISCNGTITNNDGATITGATYGVNVTGITTCVNNGTISGATNTFLVADAAAVMNITNNANIDWSIDTDKINTGAHEITNNAGNLTVHGRSATKKKFTGSLTIDNVGGGNVAFSVYSGAIECALDLTNVTIDNAVTFSGAIEANNVTINAGTFNGQLSGTGITVHGGTFTAAPAADAEGIIAGVCTFPAGPAIGGLTTADGYHAFHGGQVREVSSPGPVIVLKHGGASQTFEFLEDAFVAAQNGDEISLLGNVNTYEQIWIGTAEVNDAARTLTLDLNGHSIISAEDIVQTFLLMHGALYVKNSVPGQGEIMNSNGSGKIFFVQGTYQKNCNSRTAAISDLFTYLNIDEGVKLNATGNEGSSIVVDVVRTTTTGNSYNTKYKNEKYHGLANGVRVDIKGELHANKYDVKINGYVRYPNPSAYTRPEEEDLDVLESDTIYSPFIHVYPSATLTVPKNVEEAAPIYTGGYGRMLVEGTCKGATGLYMKSGYIVLNSTNIESTWVGNAYVVKGQESGIQAGGNAIVVESDATEGYPGHAVLIVNGDTKIQTGATGGAAFVDVVNAAGNSTIDKVTINGGTFTGDYAIVISEKTATSTTTEVVINGVSLVGEAEVANETGVAAVNSILDLTAVHTTVVGNTLIVSKGSSAPTEITNFGNTDAPQTGDVVLLPERTNANWTGTAPGVINDGDTVVLGELQIISASGDDVQELTIQNNATLNVERLIMNENARIIVEAGGSLVVEGEQGINAPAAENIVLKASEEDQATFLINPEVTSNRHPMAQVQLISKAKYDTEHDKYIWQRFGIPAYMQGLTRGDMIYDNVAAPTAVYKLDYMNNQWAYMEDEDAFVPFRCYELTTTATTPGAVYTFECPLMGNGDAELKIEGKWNYYANSYSAPIDIAQIIEDYNRHYPNVSATVYLYRAEDNWWNEINNGNIGESGVPTQIAPMQAFIFQRLTEGENPQINYARQIWNPIMDPSANVDPTPAPLRAAASMKKTVIEITAADGTKDAIRLIEGDNFSNEFDNSYDAEKYMHTESFNLFADAENPMAILATDALVGTTLSMTTTAQTSFTMTFSNVRNMNYAIRDNLTGTETEIVEGGIYMFSVPDYATVDGRFEIVPIAQMPTTIENVEEKAAVKGIYTITGQFVGNNYHELPNGIYVVDGKKIVK